MYFVILIDLSFQKCVIVVYPGLVILYIDQFYSFKYENISKRYTNIYRYFASYTH